MQEAIIPSKTASPFVVQMKGITKRFGALVANDKVDLNVEPRSLHAIVGENGAGKTTLMRMLYGTYPPDEGEIFVNGSLQRFKNPNDAIAAGVSMVSQHYSIIPELSVIDNLTLGAEDASMGVLKRKEAIERAESLAKQMGFQFDWRKKAETLSPASSQKLEILKLLWRNADILILDEPTAMLSPSDSEALFENLVSLAKGTNEHPGRTVLFVTHKLQDVMRYAQHVTVLRGGRKVADTKVSETNPEQLTRWIVGEHSLAFQLIERAPGTESLTVSEVEVKGDRGDVAVKKVSLKVRAGEIVGIAGVDGNGQGELIDALVGLRPCLSGSIKLNGQEIRHSSTRSRMDLGMRYLPEDRHRRAMIEEWSVAENASLGFIRETPLRQGAQISFAQVKARAEKLVQQFSVKTAGISAPMKSLSGGNQQRLIVARALEGSPSLLIAVQPTRGLDILGAEQVYNGIRDACSKGMAALVVSFDLDELLTLCDTIAVMYSGNLSAPLGGQEKTRDAIGRLMVGGKG